MANVQVDLNTEEIAQLKAILAQRRVQTFTDFTVDGSVEFVRPACALTTTVTNNIKDTQQVEAMSVFKIFDAFKYALTAPKVTPQVREAQQLKVNEAMLLLKAPFVTKFPRNPNFILRQYQMELAERVSTGFNLKLQGRSKLNGFYLGDEPGLGKTVQAIESALQIWDKTDVKKPVLIVCPKNVKGQWAREIRKYCPTAKITVYPDEDTGQEFYITHYEDFRADWATLTEVGFALVVFDEAHRLRHMDTQVFQAVKKFNKANGAMYWLFMSATAFHKNPGEMYGVLNIADPITFNSKAVFESKHTKVNFQNKPIGVRNPLAFARDLKHVYDVRTKLQVAPELPPMTNEKILIEMGKKHAAMYSEIRAGFTVKFNDDDFDDVVKIRGVLAELIRRQQMVSHPRMNPFHADCEPEKMDWVKEWVENNEDRQVIIFCRFQYTANAISDMIRNIKKEDGEEIVVGTLIGGLTDEMKEGLIKGFQDKEIQILVCIYESGGTGLSFEDVDYAIFYDGHWSSIQTTQAKERIHRINSTRPKFSYFLVAPASVDELIYKSVMEKMTEAALCREFMHNLDKY